MHVSCGNPLPLGQLSRENVTSSQTTEEISKPLSKNQAATIPVSAGASILADSGTCRRTYAFSTSCSKLRVHTSSGKPSFADGGPIPLVINRPDCLRDGTVESWGPVVPLRPVFGLGHTIILGCGPIASLLEQSSHFVDKLGKRR